MYLLPRSLGCEEEPKLIFSAAEQRNCRLCHIHSASVFSLRRRDRFCRGEMQIWCRLTQEIAGGALKLRAKMTVPGGAVEVRQAVWMLLELNTWRCFLSRPPRRPGADQRDSSLLLLLIFHLLWPVCLSGEAAAPASRWLAAPQHRQLNTTNFSFLFFLFKF